MQYLVMENRILYLPHIAIYDIYKPKSHLKDQSLEVLASEPENKRQSMLFKGSLEQCQRFLAALAATINAATEPAVSIDAVLDRMTDEDA